MNKSDPCRATPNCSRVRRFVFTLLLCVLAHPPVLGQTPLTVRAVEGQPLAGNVRRLIATLEYLGTPLTEQVRADVLDAAKKRDSRAIQQRLDPLVLFGVSINPELRVKVQRGLADAVIQQSGYRPVIVKVINEGTVSNRLRIVSPQAGPMYGGAQLLTLQRQAQTELRDDAAPDAQQRFLSVEIFDRPPMTPMLSGLEVEYVVALIGSSESGKREATIGFDIGAGDQDLGFRGEVPVLFDVLPAIPVQLGILDHDGTPTTARLTVRDAQNHVYPPQAKRLAPDFFFQPQIYRRDGQQVLLPPGDFQVEYSRGPEYLVATRAIEVRENEPQQLNLRLRRWIDPSDFGFYSGDHHIHGAGCSHYTSPTQGVTPGHMFAQVQGEGLNVGCVLTWGPCFDFQRQYFSPKADQLSEPLTLIKYDLEISGFGSAALGHVCLLNLENQTYPGSEGSKDRGWPTWTVPVLRWAKEQGGFTGFPHSAFDVDGQWSAERSLKAWDENQDGRLDSQEARVALLPEDFGKIDQDGDQLLTATEIANSNDRMSHELPNFSLPNMNGRGALEVCVSTAEGVCDFISAMDTARVPELNTWYHVMNAGFPLHVSGETDFPCMSSRRVGQGRVYVQLGKVDAIEFTEWCRGLAEGRSYVSDGFSHALEFTVEGQTSGGAAVALSAPAAVSVKTKVAFAELVPEGVAYGNQMTAAGRRVTGDTVTLHAPRSNRLIAAGKQRVEIVMNGRVVAHQDVPADGRLHHLEFQVSVEQSSWIALRQFPQLHTNPVRVVVGGKPIRASRASARWCAETVRLLWDSRHHRIAENEREAAYQAYQRAIATYERRAAEAPPES